MENSGWRIEMRLKVRLDSYKSHQRSWWIVQALPTNDEGGPLVFHQLSLPTLPPNPCGIWRESGEGAGRAGPALVG
jgi:hypothetical protein